MKNTFNAFIAGSILSAGIFSAAYISLEMWKERHKTESPIVTTTNHSNAEARIDFLFEELSALKNSIASTQLPNFSNRLDIIEYEITRIKTLNTNPQGAEINPDFDVYIAKNASYINSILRAAQMADDHKSYINGKTIFQIANTISDGKPLYVYRYNCGECYDNYMKMPDDEIAYFPMGDNIQINAVIYYVESIARQTNKNNLDSFKKNILARRVSSLEEVYKIAEENGFKSENMRNILYDQNFMATYTNFYNALIGAGVRNKPIFIHSRRYKEGILNLVDIKYVLTGE